MLSRIIKAKFSTLDKLRAAEAIFQVIYHHNEHINEQFMDRSYREIDSSYEQQSSQSKPEKSEGKYTEMEILQIMKQNKSQPRNILCDSIIETLKLMSLQNKINSRVSREIIDMFEPTKGIDLNLKIYSNIQTRFSQGKNSAGYFPLYPKSQFLTFIMKQLFYLNGDKFSPWRSDLTALHIIGSPGYGKSCSFLISKIILNMRIQHIIAEGCPKNSIFNVNCKFFYISSSITPALDVMSQMCEEITLDFGYLPKDLEQMSQKSQNFYNFFSRVKEIYKKKDIQVRIIIDQINHLYPQGLQTKKAQQAIWSASKIFTKPIYMISSKNNLKSEKNTALIAIAGSTQNLRQLNLDNFLTPEARLACAVQSLMFELQKKGLGRRKSLQIVQNLRFIPLLTHLSIRKEIEQIKMTNATKVEDSLIATITQALNKDHDTSQLAKNFIENITGQKKEEDKTDKTEKSQDKQVSTPTAVVLKDKPNQHTERLTKVVCFFTNNMSYNNICIRMNAVNEGEYKYIFPSSIVVTRNLDKQQGLQYLKNLDESNFFFKGYIANRGWSQVKLSMIVTLPPSKLQSIRKTVTTLMTPSLLSDLQRYSASGFKLIIKQRSGQLFENSVSSIFEKYGAEDNYFQIELAVHQFLLVKKCLYFPQKIEIIQNPNQQKLQQDKVVAEQKEALKKQYNRGLIEQKKILINLAKRVVQSQKKEEGFFVRTQDRNQAFDFMICQLYDNGLLKMVFVDTAVGGKGQVTKKTKNLLNKLLPLESFRQIIESFHVQQNVKNIQISFFVLRCHETFYKKSQIKSLYDVQSPGEQTISILRQKFPKVSKVQATAGHFTRQFQVIGKTKQIGQILNLMSDCVNLMNAIKEKRQILKP